MEDEIQPIGILKIWNEGSLDDPGEYCCEFMQHQLTGFCRGADRHITNTIQCPDQVICYNAKLREYSIHPLGTDNYIIQYCPHCGTKLPDSLRCQWFDELEQLGIDPGDKDARPEEYRTDTWWKSRDL